jgi:hypothetical protein
MLRLVTLTAAKVAIARTLRKSGGSRASVRSCAASSNVSARSERAGAIGNPPARPLQEPASEAFARSGGAPLGATVAIRFPEQWLVACSSTPS